MGFLEQWNLCFKTDCRNLHIIIFINIFTTYAYTPWKTKLIKSSLISSEYSVKPWLFNVGRIVEKLAMV